MAKTYSYKGYTFRQTSTIHANSGRYLYVIIDADGNEAKGCGSRPFCTTIQQCKEWINNKIDGIY